VGTSRGFALNKPGTSVQISRRVRSTASQQHRLARFVGGDKPLGDDDAPERAPIALQPEIRREIAGGRQDARAVVGAMARLGAQMPPRVHPGGRDGLRIQERGTEGGGQQFAHGHDPGTHAVGEFSGLREGAGHQGEVGEEAFESRAGLDSQPMRQVAVPDLDAVEYRCVSPAERGRQQVFQAIGDTRQRRMHHGRAQTG
jgi:hypothetical protein